MLRSARAFRHRSRFVKRVFISRHPAFNAVILASYPQCNVFFHRRLRTLAAIRS